jgi:cyclopropane fatty-acyl-phospholipid synthase-like methyltransferase
MSETHDDNWDKHWDKYAASASRNPAQVMRHAIIARLLRRREKMRLFDIGSGQGDMLAKLRPQLPKAEFLGAELSASGVEISKRKVPDATFLVADLFYPPAEIERFRGWATDAVCSEVLEHVDDPSAFLRAARPYMAADSQLIVTVPGGPMSAFDKHIGHRQHFTKRSLTRVLEAGGFTVHRVLRAGFPFFNLYRGVVISRGEKLAGEVETGSGSFLADLAMMAFGVLFNFNLTDSPFGWQMVAVASKSAAE